MTWKWGIIGAAGACVGYELLRLTVSLAAACAFVGLLLALWGALAFAYRRRLARLREQFSELSAEAQSRVLKEIPPEVAADLQKGKND